MRDETFNHSLRVSQIIWAFVVLIWAYAEYMIVHLQIDMHLYHLDSAQFYYRPLTATLPLVVPLGTFRRLEKTLALKALNDIEQLSRGFGFVALIFYLEYAATVIEYGLRIPK